MHKTKSNPKIHGVRVSINALQCNINVYENLYNLECFGPIYNQKKKKNHLLSAFSSPKIHVIITTFRNNLGPRR